MAQSITDTFDDDGNLIMRVIDAENGTEITLVYTDGVVTGQTLRDLADVSSWTRIERDFDTSGNLVSQTIETDSGRVITRTFDASGVLLTERQTDGGGTQPWSEVLNTFDATGALIEKTVTSDNGDITTTRYENGLRTSVTLTDGSGTRPWDRLDWQYDSAGAITERTVTNDNGFVVTLTYDTNGAVTSRTVTDPTAGQPGGPAWTEIVTTFDDAGETVQTVATQDNGDTVTTTFEAGVKSTVTVQDNNDRPWSTIKTDFNPAGERVQVTITYDNGNVVVNRLINADPVADDDTATTAFGEAVEVDVLDGDTDAEGDDLEIVDISAVTGGTAEVNDNGTPDDPTDDTVTFTPNAGFSGQGGFDYEISDGFGGTDTGTVTVTVEPPVIASLVITEIMQNPAAVSDSDGEYFEVLNTGTEAVDLNGFTISDNGSNSHVINKGGPLLVQPGAYIVLGINADTGTNGGVAVDYEYSFTFLGNADDEVILTDGSGNEVDRVEYDGGPLFPDPIGAAMELIDPTSDNNVGSNWATATQPFGDGDLGSPGAANGAVAPSVDPLINEFVANHTGSDTEAFVEIKGAANTDYSGYWLLEIEGDSNAQMGTIDEAVQLGTTNADGYWTTPLDAENGTVSYLLVENFTGSEGDDIDTTDSGMADGGLWNRLVDSIAVSDGGSGDITYGGVTLEAGFDGGGFTVGGASRIPDGTDTDAPADWVRNDFGGAGIPALDPGTPDEGEALNTPGAANALVPPPVASLLLSEIVVTPTGGEFIEIYNPTGATFDLSDIYLTDATFAGGGTFYYNLTTGTNAGGGGFGDFLARFPDLATIAAGEYQTIALAGSDDFFTAYGMDPTYELFEDGASPDGIADMREGTAGSINNQGGLTNSGEVVVLFEWDGTSDLVQDHDYAVWGDKAEGVDKTGVSIDGPDADGTGSSYAADTSIANQDVIATGGHGTGESFQRIDLTEGAEVQTGGNGVTGADEMSEDLSNTWTSNQAPTPGAAAPAVVDPGTPTALAIWEIQGNGTVSARNGEQVSVQAIVTYTMSNGFFLQEEDADTDGDATTSDGIFVFTGGAPTASVGDLVDVTGTVNEFAPDSSGESETQITASSVMTVQGGVALPSYASLPLDPASAPNLEALEGMLVSVTSGTSDPLTVITNFNLARYAEFVVSPGTQTQPTQLFDAQTEAQQVADLAQANLDSQLTIDDGLVGNGDQNPNSFPFIPNTSAGDNGNGFLDSGDTFGPDSSTFRIGTELTAPIQGVLDFGSASSFDSTAEFRVQLNTQLSIDESTNSGARPDTPDVGGNLQVAAFNVLNFFDTPGDGGDSNPARQERGALNAADLQRQADKLVAAIHESGADVIALQEIENSPTALAALVTALQAESDAWAIANGVDVAGESPFHDWQGVQYNDASGNPVDTIGTDAISTGILFNAAEVQVVDSDFHIFEEASADVTETALGVTDQQRNRPVTAATFTTLDENGQPYEFTVASVHFKSKGPSGLDSFAGNADPNVDQNDGQGFWNQVRTDAANEVKAWLEGTNATAADNYLDTGVANGNFLVMGDFNAYSQEDPSQVFNQDADYVDLLAFNGTDFTGSTADAFSFIFDGQQGALDQAFATDNMASLITGVEEWHINAQEPSLLSYNSRFTDAAFYGDNVYASSDHDPLIVGLNLGFDPLVVV